MQTNQQFENLKISTSTIVCYTNMIFDIKKLYDKLNVYTVPDGYETLRKSKLPNIKKIYAPYGEIISVRRGNQFRGLVTKDVSNKKKFFLNQLTCIISLNTGDDESEMKEIKRGDKANNINIFIFKTSIKIAGCKNDQIGENVIKEVWERHISKLTDCYTIVDDEPPNFTFETVMTNVDFLLGFKIDREILNNIMNSEKYKNVVELSKFESTSSTSVIIYFHTTVPIDYYYNKIVWHDENKTFKREKVKNISYRVKKNKKKHTTFLVFQSSKITVSARFFPRLKEDYEKFLKIINENKSSIEEKDGTLNVIKNNTTFKF